MPFIATILLPGSPVSGVVELCLSPGFVRLRPSLRLGFRLRCRFAVSLGEEKHVTRQKRRRKKKNKKKRKKKKKKKTFHSQK